MNTRRGVVCLSRAVQAGLHPYLHHRLPSGVSPYKVCGATGRLVLAAVEQGLSLKGARPYPDIRRPCSHRLRRAMPTAIPAPTSQAAIWSAALLAKKLSAVLM